MEGLAGAGHITLEGMNAAFGAGTILIGAETAQAFGSVLAMCAHYAASKGAILTLTKVFARDLPPFGVTCSAIAPGPMDTAIARAVLGADIEAALAGLPVGRLGDPVFVAELVTMLAGPRAAFVNGACWDVNGGIDMR
jgi:3-oxoacyl-[acyl-carrier protein] reductase